MRPADTRRSAGPLSGLWGPAVSRWRRARETGKLRSAVRALESAPLELLYDAGFVAAEIRHAGLVHDPRNPYGADNRFMNSGPFGLWQIPSQLARCLVELSGYDLHGFIEIGTWSGWTVSFMAAYLRRFNPWLQVITVDTGDSWGLALRPAVPMHVCRGTSADLSGRHFDLVFIDGDHSYAACAADYEHLGRHAPICMFHDINDRFVEGFPGNEGGVPRLWAEIKSGAAVDDRVLEYLDHSESDRVMGIGLIVRVAAVRRPRASSAAPPQEGVRSGARSDQPPEADGPALRG